jgi:4-aminobutyrate aminotransferase-like enzyme
MHGLTVFDGSADTTNAVLRAALDEGLLAWSAGHRPSRLRFLLPLDTTDEELETGFSMLEKALARVGEDRGLPC